MHRAAQRVGVAVALEEAPSGLDGLVAIGIDPHDQLGIARLDRRMDQIAGEHRLVAAPSGAHREMIRRMARGRRQPDVVLPKRPKNAASAERGLPRVAGIGSK